MITITIGALVGVVAGYRGGAVDTGLMRFTDFALVVPLLALAIILAAILGPRLHHDHHGDRVHLVAGHLAPRALQVLSIRERPYVERARALGGGDGHIIAHHVLPNVMPVILANAVLVGRDRDPVRDRAVVPWPRRPDPASRGAAILEEAFAAGATTSGYWWWIGRPGVCIVLVVLAFTMIGFALDEVINPKLRDR